ncbi:replication-relaxation family protein [Microtetraspora fusca]|uniref:Replication-relaxation family protein n=1 Tax=Microtetraspora fusca TaxID=1997 RepID=A0ABW6V8V0_MICFU
MTRPSIRQRASCTVPPRASRAVIAELAARLTPRDREILELVHEHRVLTTHQLSRAYFTCPDKARHRLLDLYRLAALDRARPWTPSGSAPWHWVLGCAGAAVLAAHRGVTVKELGYRHDQALAVCHSATLGHLIGVNDFFTWLKSETEGELTAWWGERRCAQLWGDIVRPDGYGRWAEGGVEVDFFLEHDTGSETLARVVAKLNAYAELVEATGISTPVLFWLPSTRREQHLRAEIGTPEAPAATAVQTTSGAREAVWLPIGSARRRLRLIELADLSRSERGGDLCVE